MSGILCPKSSVLEKLAQIFYTIREDFPGNGALPTSVIDLLNDEELLTWYTGMAQLNFVPFLPKPYIVDDTLPVPDLLPSDLFEVKSERKSLNIKLPGTYQPEWSDLSLTPQQINDAICGTGRRGYQIFAKSTEFPEGVASYTEAETVQVALARCVGQFPPDEGYSGHGVKDIETQVKTLLRPWEDNDELQGLSLTEDEEVGALELAEEIEEVEALSLDD